MTSNEILKADLLDILFEKRNKLYGAYALRRAYNRHLMMSVVSALGLSVLLIWLLSAPEQTVSSTPSTGKVFELTPVNLPPAKAEIPHADLPVLPSRNEALGDYSNIVLVENVDPEDQMLTVNEIATRAISNRNLDGFESHILQSIPEAPASGIPGPSSEVPEPASQPFVPIESQPEFPGGIGSWKEFLRRYLNVPSALDPGEKRTVLVNFVVDTDGTVTGFEILQSAGALFDREVLRVLKKMPKWKPAQQNGRNVSVTFTQPVTFVGEYL